MAQYLVAIHLPDDFDPSSVDKAMERDIDVLNEEMEAKRIRLFAGGLRPAREAKSLRAQPEGKVLMTDGPFLETKEHVGGFWILEAADMDEALAWGRKAVVACRAPVEVRALFPSDPTALLARKPLKEGMTQYLAAGHLPVNFDPSSVTEAMMRDMGALNEEMEAKGVTILTAGLHPASDAKSLRAQPGGKVLITDGPYLETKEHVGGLSILQAADMDEALAWARTPSPAGRRARSARFSARTPHRNSVYRACRRRAKTHIQGDRMRKIRIIEHISLDGVIQAPGGPKEDPGYPYGGWAAPHDGPEGGEAIVAAHGEDFDLLLGRRTYDIWSGFWPTAPKSPMADAINGATKYIATHRRDSLTWGPADGSQLIVWGSSMLTPVLLEHELADEILLLVFPVLLGTGKRIFSDGTPPPEFKLVSSKAVASGVIISTYKPNGPLRTGTMGA
jgi:dihydrofolate reductase